MTNFWISQLAPVWFAIGCVSGESRGKNTQHIRCLGSLHDTVLRDLIFPLKKGSTRRLLGGHWSFIRTYFAAPCCRSDMEREEKKSPLFPGGSEQSADKGSPCDTDSAVASRERLLLLPGHDLLLVYYYCLTVLFVCLLVTTSFYPVTFSVMSCDCSYIPNRLRSSILNTSTENMETSVCCLSMTHGQCFSF